MKKYQVSKRYNIFRRCNDPLAQRTNQLHPNTGNALVIRHDDLWGANWYPSEQRIEFETLINIRPRLGNRNVLIQDEDIRQKVESMTRELLGGVQ
jgi:Protein of unknown function (DUF5674)